ncbi:MAG: hypothetical protein O3B72_07685 [Proteobacteria bacterium]|nr:hypothetical protein [Pseudomonadota bacterium]
MSNEPQSSKFTELAVVSFPLRLGNLLLLVMFAGIFYYLHRIWLSLGAAGFVLTAATTYVVALLYLSYLVFLADYTSQGYQKMPAFSMNVVDASRWKVFRVMLLFSLFASLLPLVDSVEVQRLILALGAFILPLATGVLIVENSMIAATNPLNWLKILSATGFDGHLFRLFAIECLLLIAIYVTFIAEVVFPAIFAALLLSMMLFRSIGALLHRNAEVLNLSVQFGHQIDASNQQRHHDKDIAQQVEALKNICEKGGGVTAAFRQYEALLAKNHFQSEAAFFEHFRSWSSSELAVMAGRGYIERLIQHRRFSMALEVLSFCFKVSGGDFRLTTVERLLTLVQYVESLEQKRMLARLLKDAPDQYTNDPRVADALIMAGRLYAEDLDFLTTREILDRIEREHPLWAQDDGYLETRRLLDRVS